MPVEAGHTVGGSIWRITKVPPCPHCNDSAPHSLPCTLSEHQTFSLLHCLRTTLALRCTVFAAHCPHCALCCVIHCTAVLHRAAPTLLWRDIRHCAGGSGHRTDCVRAKLQSQDRETLACSQARAAATANALHHNGPSRRREEQQGMGEVAHESGACCSESLVREAQAAVHEHYNTGEWSAVSRAEAAQWMTEWLRQHSSIKLSLHRQHTAVSNCHCTGSTSVSNYLCTVQVSHHYQHGNI